VRKIIKYYYKDKKLNKLELRNYIKIDKLINIQGLPSVSEWD